MTIRRTGKLSTDTNTLSKWAAKQRDLVAGEVRGVEGEVARWRRTVDANFGEKRADAEKVLDRLPVKCEEKAALRQQWADIVEQIEGAREGVAAAKNA